MKIIAAKKILKENDRQASELREQFEKTGTFVVNLVGSPGCGKTTLLEALFDQLDSQLTLGVIEGDLASSIDAQRIAERGIEVVQINTEGMCHLDATMIGAAIETLDLEKIDLLIIENVGNLVCTASFDLGEHLRLVILSVSEGDDKIAKYPTIFRGSDALLLTKTDMLETSNFQVDRAEGDMQHLNPDADVLKVSALTGGGVKELTDWLIRKCGKQKSKANSRVPIAWDEQEIPQASLRMLRQKLSPRL